ncbi:hypothetical protein [Ferrovibrio sp.]|uniref:hypothetical protein n=1 Tax=Ferrovibrio sp. TaxID=1917215 RepID=UPI0035AD9CBA
MTISTALSAPHKFEKLLGGDRPSSVVIGAGFSAGYVPFPGALLAEIKERAETALGLGPIRDHNDDLYVWAEKVLAILAAQGSTHPKLRLAEAMGLLTDQRWAVDVELNGTCARHRVMARFSREDLFSALWSLNWDCMFESALESIGFRRGGPAREQPWRTTYTSVVTAGDFQNIALPNVLCIRKPHGCFHSLTEARLELDNGNSARAQELSERFLLTATELREERTGALDVRFFRRMLAELESDALLILGWSVSEPYLQGAINALGRDPGVLEDLSIVDIGLNSDGHATIATAFKLTSADIYFAVTKIREGFDIDDFMLWLQARYCVTQMLAVATDAREEELAAALKDILDGLLYRTSGGLVVSFADKFLPSWTRLCWRSEVIDCPGFRPENLNLDMPHEHVPWRIPAGTRRYDLHAAGRLLRALIHDPARWDVETLPGFLFDVRSKTAVITLPAWGSPRFLASFRAQIAQAQGQLHMIEGIAVLPLHPTTPMSELSERTVSDIREAITELWPIPGMVLNGPIPVLDTLAL